MTEKMEQQAAPVAETTGKKLEAGKKPVRVAGRQKMTLEECERLGLDPRPYGLSGKQAKK